MIPMGYMDFHSLFASAKGSAYLAAQAGLFSEMKGHIASATSLLENALLIGDISRSEYDLLMDGLGREIIQGLMAR